MEAVVTVGLDIAKSVFQVHGVDQKGAVVVRRRLPRMKVLSFFEQLPRVNRVIGEAIDCLFLATAADRMPLDFRVRQQPARVIVRSRGSLWRRHAKKDSAHHCRQ